MQKVCYQCSISWLTACWCTYTKVTTSNNSRPMIQAKYIFTISIDDDWKRTINCELPPHNLETERWLYSLLWEITKVYNYCLTMLNDSNEMLLKLPNKQWKSHSLKESIQ